MGNRIDRLRLWLLAGAVLLLAVVAAFIGSARYLRRHALSALGSRLGVDIRSETNGFTYSQSVQGRTVYTIHAAKEIEHADGKITLHDVSMILYGRAGNRADRIYGKDFEYDQNAGVVRALGLVHIDLGGPGLAKPGAGKAAAEAKPSADEAEGGDHVLHATTSGLVYLDKLGVAATNEAIDFETSQMKGHAVGADYSTDTGVLLLHSAVTMDGMANKRPVHLAAATAQLDERGQRAVLGHARYVSGEQILDADDAVILTRVDNSLDHMEGDGHVTLRSGATTVGCAHADVTFGQKNRAQLAHLTGGVRYELDDLLRQGKGEAQQGEVRFSADGTPAHATFTGGVKMTERVRQSTDAGAHWSTRDLSAERFEAQLVEATPRHAVLRDAVATGLAHLTVADAMTGAETELVGDTLTLHMLPQASPRAPLRADTVAARGHTLLRQKTATGLEQTSTGDTLDVTFSPDAPAKKPARASVAAAKGTGAGAGQQVASAVQTGHLHLVRAVPAHGTHKADLQDATAERATYDGAMDRMTLSGGVHLSDSGSLLLADRVVFDRPSGDADASGNLRVSYVQPPVVGSAKSAQPAEPVHVLAERAELREDSDATTFYGKPVRMWQGGSQVQAPVVTLRREERQMTARGDAASGFPTVHTLLVNTGMKPAGATHVARKPKESASAGAATAGAGAKPGTGSKVIRVESTSLVYSDADRSARFTGDVTIANAGETIRSREATAFLSPAPPAKDRSAAGADAGITLNGSLEKVVAEGDVRVDDTGRKATGERLVYTAADGLAVLTGTPAVLPSVTDTGDGSRVTAPAFVLHTDDNSVEALRAAPGDSAGRQRVSADAPVR